MTERADYFAEEDLAVKPLKVSRLNAELRQQAREMGMQQARYLVDAYYSMQEYRKSGANKMRAVDNGDTPPMPLLDWLTGQFATLEVRLRDLLGNYAQGSPVGEWSLSQVGIGPVLAAGLLAYIDMGIAKTPGHIYRFAGLDPTQEWMGAAKAKDRVALYAVDDRGVMLDEDLAQIATSVGLRTEKLLKRLVDREGKALPPTPANVAKALSLRPWNARMKVLCWKIGQSFVKVSGNEDAVYGRLWAERKLLEVQNNEAGLYAEQAARALETKKYGKETDAYKCYSSGKLPPAHVQARSERWVVKLFLSHWWEVAYEVHYGEKAPEPYPIAILGHADRIAVPGWPLE
jgi:hypothetical protein